MEILRKAFKLFKSILIFVKYKFIYGRKCKMRLVNSIEGKILIKIEKNGNLDVGKFLMSRGPLYLRVCKNGKLKIGNNVWIGANCTILKDVRIGDGQLLQQEPL